MNQIKIYMQAENSFRKKTSVEKSKEKARSSQPGNNRSNLSSNIFNSQSMKREKPVKTQEQRRDAQMYMIEKERRRRLEEQKKMEEDKKIIAQEKEEGKKKDMKVFNLRRQLESIKAQNINTSFNSISLNEKNSFEKQIDEANKRKTWGISSKINSQSHITKFQNIYENKEIEEPNAPFNFMNQNIPEDKNKGKKSVDIAPKNFFTLDPSSNRNNQNASIFGNNNNIFQVPENLENINENYSFINNGNNNVPQNNNNWLSNQNLFTSFDNSQPESNNNSFFMNNQGFLSNTPNLNLAFPPNNENNDNSFNFSSDNNENPFLPKDSNSKDDCRNNQMNNSQNFNPFQQFNGGNDNSFENNQNNNQQ